jgi:2-polyprenyl-3-methyl-5-hydroxy-6-metoxy-1,4-benzoquinol methylase
MHLADALQQQRPVLAFVECSDGRLTAMFAAQWLGDEQSWPPAVRALLGDARGRVLDVGAGGGRHAVYLAQQGHHVTALDTSPLAIDTCRHRGVPQQVLGDVKDVQHLFRESPPFQTVLLLGNNVGLLESAEHGRDVLRQLHAVTTDDAQILAEGRSPGMATAEEREYAERNRAGGGLPGESLIRVRYRTTATPWFRYLFCDPSELAAMAASAGWEMSKVEGFNYPMDPPDGAAAYTAVLTKATPVCR